MKILVLSLMIIFISFFVLGFAILGNGGIKISKAPEKLYSEFNLDESQLKQIKKMSIKTVDANINIIPTEGKKLNCKLAGYVDKNEKATIESNVNVGASTIGDELVLEVKHNEEITFGGRYLNLYVYLPTDYQESMVLHTKSGNILNDQKIGVKDVEVEVGSGNVIFKELNCGNASMQTGSGNIRLLEAKIKDLKMKAGSGNITATGQIGVMKSSTNSGNIEIGTKKMGGNIIADASSGNIDVYLDKSEQFELETKTGSGNIETAFSLVDNVLEKNDNYLLAKKGDGKNRVEITTHSGNIKVKPVEEMKSKVYYSIDNPIDHPFDFHGELELDR